MQTIYNEVRVASLKPAATARDLLGTKPERRMRSAENKESGGVTGHDLMENVGGKKNVAKELKRFKEKVDSRL